MTINQSEALCILTHYLTPRVRYVFSLLFDWVWPLPYRLTDDPAVWARHTGPRMHYGPAPVADLAFRLPAGALLAEKEIRPQLIEMDKMDGLPFFFRQPAFEADFPFDLPALAFYLATRYEEYLPFAADRHGRFPASESLAARAGFLHIPLINRWVEHLVRRLTERYPSLRAPRPPFRFLPTFDIDMAWAFRHRPWWLQAAGAGKTLLTGRWADLKTRASALLGHSPDPFFSFPLLRRLHPPGEDNPPLFFFLLGDYGPFDKNTRHTHPAFRALLANLARDYDIGIHLSYRSNRRPERIPVEIARLSAITRQPVRRNRQHFLKLHLPDTYRRLIAHGIREDYTMGYADALGFRAGLASAFPWYDLQKEEPTELIVHPFQVMDVTLKNYLQYTPETAWEPVWEIVESTRAAGGVFCTLWHNSSFSDLEGWAAWEPFYTRLLREIKALN